MTQCACFVARRCGACLCHTNPLTLSRPVAAQSDGTDLDPHNLKWQPRGEGGGRSGAPAAVAAVEEGASCRGGVAFLPAFSPGARAAPKCWHSLYYMFMQVLQAWRDAHTTASAMYAFASMAFLFVPA